MPNMRKAEQFPCIKLHMLTQDFSSKSHLFVPREYVKLLLLGAERAKSLLPCF
jgi:hypothetical protein